MSKLRVEFKIVTKDPSKMFRIPPCLEAIFSKQHMQSNESKILEITLQLYIKK